MKERPIIFSSSMVRAILDGRKTQTRRLVKPQPDEYPPGNWFWTHRDVVELKVEDLPAFCPYGVPCDRLWVKEAWAQRLDRDHLNGTQLYAAGVREAWYWADGPGKCARTGCAGAAGRYRAARFMPRWASRITLEVTGVRVERLQEITDDDAKAEGAFFTDYGRNCGHKGGGWTDVGDCPAPAGHHPQRNGWSMVPTTGPDQCLGSPRWALANLWDKLNERRAPWRSDPWVWVIEFQKAI